MKPDSLGPIPVMHMSKRNNNFEIKYNEKKVYFNIVPKRISSFQKDISKNIPFVTRIMLIYKD